MLHASVLEVAVYDPVLVQVQQQLTPSPLLVSYADSAIWLPYSAGQDLGSAVHGVKGGSKRMRQRLPLLVHPDKASKQLAHLEVSVYDPVLVQVGQSIQQLPHQALHNIWVNRTCSTRHRYTTSIRQLLLSVRHSRACAHTCAAGSRSALL